MIYAEIPDRCFPSISHIREQRENDGGASLSDEEWDLVLSSSICSGHALIQFEVLHWLNFSTATLAKISPNLSPIRDRCKQALATIHHMLWCCQKLVPFWSSFFDLISKTYEYDIQTFPIGAVVLSANSSDVFSLPAFLKTVGAFSALLARHSVLLKLKDTTPPTHNQWMRDKMQNRELEKIRCTLTGFLKQLYTTWDPFTNYVNSLSGLELNLHLTRGVLSVSKLWTEYIL